MMELKLQLLLLVISLLFAGIILFLVRKETLELKYSLAWLVTGLGLVVIAIQPGIIYAIASLMSIALPVNALFLIAIFFVLFILLTLTIAVSRAAGKIRRLAQEISILKLELVRLKEDSQEGHSMKPGANTNLHETR